MPQNDLNLFLNKGGIFLTTQEIRTLKEQFPHPRGVNYQEVIHHIRNDLTQKRLAAIDHTFDQFAQEGKVSISILLAHLDTKKHPHVRSLSKTAEKSRADIENGLSYWTGDGQHLTQQ